MSLRTTFKKNLPWPFLYLYRKIYYFPKDFSAACGFIFHSTKSPTTFFQRVGFVYQCYRITYFVDCPHTEHEIITVARTILNLGSGVPGVVAEAGAFHGGSTAKFSLVAKLCGRELAVFDSFEGMPVNNEVHGKSIYNREHHFPKGSHAVSLDEVTHNVATYGDSSRTTFYKGWFENTLPTFTKPVALALINADLVGSTKTCLKYFYPLLSKGGIIYSQDAHFPWIIEVLESNTFWQNEMHVQKPKMDDLGSSKLVAIHPY